MAYSKKLTYTFETKGSADWYKKFLKERINETKGLSNFWSHVDIHMLKEYSYSGEMFARTKTYEAMESQANMQFLRKLAVKGKPEKYKRQSLPMDAEFYHEHSKDALDKYSKIAQSFRGITPENLEERNSKDGKFYLESFSLDHAKQSDLQYLDEDLARKKLRSGFSMSYVDRKGKMREVPIDVPLMDISYGKRLLKHIDSKKYVVEAKVVGKKELVDALVKESVPVSVQ